MVKIPYDITDWLLKGDPWVVYRTRIDLLCEDKKEQEVKKVYEEMLSHQKIKGLLSELKNWPGEVLSSHKSAGQLYHKLTFIADLGISKDEPEMEKITSRIFEHISEEGPFTLPTNIPKHFGGTGKDEWAWALCDAPILIYALSKIGFKNEPNVIRARNHILSLIRDNGWPCTVSKNLGKFRGPGKKEDLCPYATLVSLKMLLEFEELQNSEQVRIGAESLLQLWKESETRHPYMFYMGTDFRKIKAPYIWFDLLHVLEVLSKIASIKRDDRFIDMLNVLERKKEPDGKFKAESAWLAWKEWEFSNKKLPSQWITFLAYRIFSRVNKSDTSMDYN